GLDMALAIHDYVAQDLCNENRAPRPMRERVERGELGAKTGKGFYDWTKKSLADVKARRDGFVLDFLQRWRDN
ncbi:MAG: 3-hydroxyacyl-CoA dehydrogenase family protein, partial [Bryobacteraceae bacterium]